MAYIPREMGSLLQSLAESYSGILLTGPRQVGKSTLLQHCFGKGRENISLDAFEHRGLAKNDPNLFFQMHSGPILIDEIQYAPDLFSAIKIRIDGGAPPGTFLMTGSQSFRLMRLAQETLAGRIAVLELPPLSQAELFHSELNHPFTLDLEELVKKEKIAAKANAPEIFERIWKGGMPGYVSGRYPKRDVFFSSYVSTYLERDISELIPGIDRTVFRDFLRAVACRTAQLLNFQSIAKDIGISAVTAKKWLGLLEAANIIYFLHPYSRNDLKRVVKAPKMYFFDTGLAAFLTRYSSPEILMDGAMRRQIFENYVVNQIRKNLLNQGIEPPLYYYRDFDQSEIDLLLEQDGKLFPIEIKTTATPTLSMLKTLDKIKNLGLPIGTGAIVCLAEHFSAFNSEKLIIPAWMI